MNVAIFGLVVLGVLALVVLFESVILNEINKFFKVSKTTFKLSLVTLSLTYILSILVGIVGLFLLLPSTLLVLVTAIVVFALLYKRFFGVGWVKSVLIWFTSTLTINFLLILVIVPLRLYVVEFSLVAGDSMAPAYVVDDYVVINKFNRSFEKGEVVIAKMICEKGEPCEAIRRVSAISGERIGDVVLADGEYYLSSDIGDKLEGVVKKQDIVGKAWFRLLNVGDLK